ncbi:MAG: hypothetical protein AUG95_01495 [Nitrospirae bacterium 13_1_20CM_4_62_6]|nr:MAG: hypothetical protein AUG95_01495 [Nitrospirae bacterium 13_1_20CM_4_62_6]
MRQLRNKNSLFALSWLAILLAATASADVVEDLVFEPFEANAAESSQLVVGPSDHSVPPSLAGFLPPLRI